MPWLSPKDMGPEVLETTQDRITHLAVEQSATKLVPANSVAIVVRSGIIERTLPVALVPFETTLNQDMKALVPAEDIDPRWIAWGLRAFEKDLLRNCRKAGTTVASIEIPRFSEFRLPIPSLLEQQRILAVLEDHLSRLDAAESYLWSSIRKVAGYSASALAKGIRGELVDDDLALGSGHDLLPPASSGTPLNDEDRTWPIPETWAWTRLGSLFEIFVGATPSRSDPSLWNGDLAWVSSGEVAFRRIAATRETITRIAAGNVNTRIHPPGTVLLAMIGEGKTRGQAAILDIEAAHNQNCASIRVSTTPILPEYVYAFLRERYLETRRAASGGNQLALNRATVMNIPMPVPPLGTQRRLVARFEELDRQLDRLTVALGRAKAANRVLRASLLDAAFSRRLTGHTGDMNLVEEMASV